MISENLQKFSLSSIYLLMDFYHLSHDLNYFQKPYRIEALINL